MITQGSLVYMKPVKKYGVVFGFTNEDRDIEGNPFVIIKCGEGDENKFYFTLDDIREINLETTKKIVLAEDGSVDTEKLENDGFYVISYRQGAKPPIIIDMEQPNGEQSK